MKTEITPNLIQPDFLGYESIVSTTVVISIIGLILLSVFVIYKFYQVYPLLDIYFSITTTGMKKSAYQLTSKDIFKKLEKSKIIRQDQLTIINNIKYQQDYKESSADLKKVIYRIIVTVLAGKFNAV